MGIKWKFLFLMIRRGSGGEDSCFSCHLEVSARMCIAFNTTLVNMMEKQQEQISRCLSSTKNEYFSGQEQALRKLIFLRGEGPESQRNKPSHSVVVSWLSLIYSSLLAASCLIINMWTVEKIQISLLYFCYIETWGIFGTLGALPELYANRWDVSLSLLVTLVPSSLKWL